MTQPDSPESNGSLLGRLAVHYKLITMDQLAVATEELGRPFSSKKLGELLVEKGWIRAAQLDQLLRVQQQVIARERAKREAPPAIASSEGPGVAVEGTPEAVGPGVHAATQAAVGDPLAAAKALGLGGPAPGAPGASPPAGLAPAASASAAPVPSRAASPPPAASAPAALAQAVPVAVAPPAPSASAASASPPPAANAQAPPGSAHGVVRVASHDVVADPDARRALERLLADAVASGASDVHVHAAVPLRLRRHGRLVTLDGGPIPRERTEQMILALLDPAQREAFLRDGEIDLCLTVPGVGRFRTNLYHQQRGMDAVFRAIPATPPTLEQLGLPSTLAKLTHFHQGMVLITGPAGCGKSSTMAALVNLINEERRDHILTIEDPIEYLHPSKRCIVNQRSVKRHTESFARALRAALREDPDVIVIGELRDLETISLAMTAAETGHFVLGTLHTNDTIRTVNRLVGSFPSDQQGQVRTMLAESLRAVLSQRLVTTAAGDARIPATELLLVNKAVGNLIRENKTFQIRSILQTGATQGMCLLDQSLAGLIAAGTITREEAARHAEDAKKLAA